MKSMMENTIAPITNGDEAPDVEMRRGVIQGRPETADEWKLGRNGTNICCMDDD